MTKQECMEALSKHANIEPVITSTGLFLPTLDLFLVSTRKETDKVSKAAAKRTIVSKFEHKQLTYVARFVLEK
jgi:hypothetical protein